MPGTKTLILALLALAGAPARFSGDSALEFTRRIVALGPRTVDSEAHRKMERYITSELRRFGCQVEEDTWTASTPLGPKRMNNLIAKVPGKSNRLVVFSGHYDTKIMPGIHFVGANDGGASAGFLLEMARVLCGKPRSDSVWLVWFDGEEALRQDWSTEDSLYGSRRLAARWRSDGTAARIKALINVDMIGDRDLVLLEEWNSTAWLRELVWRTAAELGSARHFPRNPGAIEDDHAPFLAIGVPALDLIDFEYGPNNSHWHTDRDTVDKLGARSFQVVGDVLLRTLEKLEAR
jgi:Zn-dependent M28 family amino/carboxypeptidase